MDDTDLATSPAPAVVLDMTDWIAYRFDGVDWLIASGAVEPWKNDKETRASLFAFLTRRLLVARRLRSRVGVPPGRDGTLDGTLDGTPSIPRRPLAVQVRSMKDRPTRHETFMDEGATTAGVVVRVARARSRRRNRRRIRGRLLHDGRNRDVFHGERDAARVRRTIRIRLNTIGDARHRWSVGPSASRSPGTSFASRRTCAGTCGRTSRPSARIRTNRRARVRSVRGVQATSFPVGSSTERGLVVVQRRWRTIAPWRTTRARRGQGEELGETAEMDGRRRGIR